MKTTQVSSDSSVNTILNVFIFQFVQSGLYLQILSHSHSILESSFAFLLAIATEVAEVEEFDAELYDFDHCDHREPDPQTDVATKIGHQVN